MEASFFKNAKNVHIGGNTQFNNIVAGRDVRQVNTVGHTYNTNSNNTTSTVIQDSYNDNSRHITGSNRAQNYRPTGSAERYDEFVGDDSPGWTDASETDSSEEGNNHQRGPTRKKTGTRTSKAGTNRRPGATGKGTRSAPQVHMATPAAGSTSTGDGDSQRMPAPTHAHTASAPAVPTLTTSSPPTLSPAPRPASHLAVPQPQAHSVNTSTASLTQSMATPTSVAESIPSPNRPASAPIPSTLGSPGGSSLTVPSVQAPSTSVGQADLTARHRRPATREETRDEIRRKLVNVAQSVPMDKFFILKDQATRANKISALVEGSNEKIQRYKELVQLSQESHAVTFVAIMAAEEKIPDAKRTYNLLRILDDIEELVVSIVQKEGLSKWKPFKREENKKLVKSYRKKLETWLQDFQNDADVTIDFALHQASIALSEALYTEQQYEIVVQAPSQGASGASPPTPQMQTPALSPGSTSISDVARSAVSLGSGSSAVMNGEGSGTRVIHQNSHNNNSRNYYK
ncbi:hypothetical protein D9619_013583 [Psilocybe cf. subviscida]|uniref:Uncharacterized protein n=1 Tax=Psilocybe cf. subviscida TaxID=2480587 RepID=A0A8H5AQS2_9AGAR|nr:hypothetical protein D9619_013583 [Psilocybe cf. subviscida]